ncbi:hypothetical protein HETIRDRAFT_326639 [Heterobasidion irregulare TC 32-1]|uniref:Uncharacterized protein n=1 Tax=Heterobasidion irregulare (strain TC 32-1) TaxID=747525 RepID=W4JUQ8_HETIT|nr:uncharacterized protein HETIRDRAFT_326639 [Heterobasidion irregulare TC 32-1]ETW77273.1 hypothetical protein HETIRDRAFT_326639 [Heterobasidion irregulare TC 32-1]
MSSSSSYSTHYPLPWPLFSRLLSTSYNMPRMLLIMVTLKIISYLLINETACLLCVPSSFKCCAHRLLPFSHHMYPYSLRDRDETER